MGVGNRSFFRTLLSWLPGLAVFAVLIGLGVVGILTDWKLGSTGTTKEAEEAEKEAGPNKPGETDVVRFESAEAMRKSGIRTEVVGQRTMTRVVVANGSIDYVRPRMAFLAPRVPGHVWAVFKQAGDKVRQGEILGLIDAAEVGRAKGEFQQALRLLDLKTRTLERQRQAGSAIPETQLHEAETAVAEARIRLYTAEQALANLGLPIRANQVAGMSDQELTGHLRFLGLEAIADSLKPAPTTANLLPLVAPFEGLVLRSNMTRGEMASSTQPEFVIADVSRMWVTLDVRQEDVGWVQKGQVLTFTLDVRRGEADPPRGGSAESAADPGAVSASGKVEWISTAVDNRTRTVPVRAEVSNEQGQFRAGGFGTGRITIDTRPDAVAVPTGSVQWWDAHKESSFEPYVFVCAKDGLTFRARKVRLGMREADFTEILDGLRPGEVIATAGSHILRSELFRSEIGGGD